MVFGIRGWIACLALGGWIGAQSPSPGEGVHFTDEVHTVWLGRSAVIPFALPEPSEDDVRPELVWDERYLELLRPPTALAG